MMDRESGCAATGETEAAAAAAFGDTTRQVGWRRGAGAGHFGVTFRVLILLGQGAAAEVRRRGLRARAFRGDTPATGCQREKTGVSRKGSVLKVAKAVGDNPGVVGVCLVATRNQGLVNSICTIS